jgi:osmotically-inducible protein OsmY
MPWVTNNKVIQRLLIFLAGYLLLLTAFFMCSSKLYEETLQPPEQLIENTILKTRLVTFISFNEQLNKYNIDVSVNRNIVCLLGQVSTVMEKKLVEDLIHLIDEGLEIKNYLTVNQHVLLNESKQRMFMRVSERSTVSKVEYRLLMQKALNGSLIRLKAEKQTLYMEGEVSQLRLKKLAERIAVNTCGVRVVVNKLKVNPHLLVVTQVDPWLEPQKSQHDIDNELLQVLSNLVKYDKSLSLNDLKISVAQGVVTVQGKVYSHKIKEYLLFLIANTPEVIGYKDQLLVVS